MKEFKGTKGEWKLSETITFGRQMVDLGDFNGSIDVWYHNGESITKDEATANAKLIAAAPDLLKALLEVKEILKKEWPKQEWDEFANKETSFTKAINKALN